MMQSGSPTRLAEVPVTGVPRYPQRMRPPHYRAPGLERTVVQRTSRRPARLAPIRLLWWQPGVYASVPAVVLWIVARLPADFLGSLFGSPAASPWLNHAGDTVFVTGWVASAAWLWFTRRRPPPAPEREPGDASGHAEHQHHHVG